MLIVRPFLPLTTPKVGDRFFYFSGATKAVILAFWLSFLRALACWDKRTQCQLCQLQRNAAPC